VAAITESKNWGRGGTLVGNKEHLPHESNKRNVHDEPPEDEKILIRNTDISNPSTNVAPHYSPREWLIPSRNVWLFLARKNLKLSGNNQ